MSSRNYGGPLPVRVTAVPARAGYLVRQGDAAGLRRAVQEASSRWGGMTEPIIPVRAGGSVEALWRQVVTIADIEGLVDVGVGDDAVTAAGSLALPLVPLKDIDHYGSTKWTTHPAGIDGYFTDPPPTIATAAAPLWEVVAAGDVAPEHVEPLARDGIGFYRPYTSDGVARAVLSGQTLLDRTLPGLCEHMTSQDAGPIPTIVWVTPENGVRDCLMFWNLRALRPLRFPRSPIVLLPRHGVEHWVQFADQFAAVLRRPDEFSPDAVFTSLRVSPGDQDTIAGLLGLVPSEEPIRSGHRWLADLREAPFTYRTNVDPWPWFVFEREYGEVVNVETHLVDARATIRVSPAAALTSGYTLLRLACSAFDGLPRRPSIAEKVRTNTTWHKQWLQVATDGRREYQFDIAIPTLDECVRTMLGLRTRRYSVSDKGRAASAVMEGVDLSRLLQAGLTEVVSELTTPRAKELARELRRQREAGLPEDEVLELASRWGGRHERRHLPVTKIQFGTPRHAVLVLEELCRLGWAERGVQCDCDRCGIRSFVPVEFAAGPPRCPGCRAEAAYAAADAGVEIHYRLNSFIDRASDQGIMPHLLAVAALQQRSTHTHLLPGCDVEFHDGQTCEIDIVGVYDGRVVSGEIKTSEAEFTVEQLRWDTDKSHRLGADFHLLATPATLSPEVRALAESETKRAGLELLVLDRSALRPEAPASS